MRLLLTVFFFEAGLILLFLPWSSYWERNYFDADPVPGLDQAHRIRRVDRHSCTRLSA